MPRSEPEASQGERLDSWKEIAAYLDRDVRTVARWEKSEGLPVHRHLHKKKPTVYAFKHEVDAWWAGRRQSLVDEPRPRAPSLAQRWALLGSFVAAAVLASFYLLPARTGEPEQEPEDAPEFLVRNVFAEGSRPGVAGCEPRAVAPAGHWMACFGDNGLGIIDLAGKRLRLLTDGWESGAAPTGGPVFSPNAEQVAYAWTRLGSEIYELGIADVIGGSRTIYRGDKVEPEPLAWSPDGLWLATNLLRPHESWELVLISPVDGTVRFVQRGVGARPRHVTFSPDGRHIAYESPPVRDGFADLHLVALDGGEVTPLTTHPRDDGYPFWLSDGSGIVFLSDRTGSVDLWLLPMDGPERSGSPELLRRDLGYVYPIALTESGSLYYFASGGLSDVYTADVDFETGRVIRPPQPFATELTGVTRHLTWSPDGSRVAFVSSRGWRSRVGVVVRDLDSGTEWKLDGMPFALRPQWSPDGDTLLARGTDIEQRRGTFELDAETGAVVRQRIAGLHETGYYLPNTDALVVTDLDFRLGSGAIYRIEPTNAEPTPLFVSDPTASLSRMAAVSPAGDAIAFTISDRPTKTARLAILDAHGGPMRELVRVPDAKNINVQAFTPDARFVLYVQESKESGRELLRVSTETGDTVPIELAINDAYMFSVHPNGRTIGFTVFGGEEMPLYVMERAVPRP